MIIVDTGPLVALVNSSDADHECCAKWIETVHEPLLVPNTVLTEVCYLLQRRCGSLVEARFYGNWLRMTDSCSYRSSGRT